MALIGKIKKAIGKCATVALGAEYVRHYRKNEIRDDLIFYSSQNGAGLLCSPYAVFDALMKSDEFDDYEHVWQVNDPEERALLQVEYSGCRNVRFVGKNSAGYFDAITSAKYIITNITMPFYFMKKPGQIYVNTWHGIPLKTLGFDVPDGKYSARNTTRNFLQTDYIISPCRCTTKIFKHSYKLEGLYSGKLTECGYPRNDLIFSADRDYVIDKLSVRGTIIDTDKKIILYAPTWKGTSYEKADNDIARYDELCDYLSEHIDTEKYQILIKPHPTVYKLLSEDERKSGKYVSSSINTNELLSITDILVSDYSSVFFDFLLTDRPIIFYIPDVESYKEYRGVYFGLDALPGPYSCDMGDIAEWINDAENVRENYAEQYDKMKSWSCEFDDGNVSQKVIDAVLHGDESECRMITDFAVSEKKRILAAGGRFEPGERTEKILMWLDGLNYDENDVTLMIEDDGKCTDEIMRVNDNVRVMCRCGLIPKSLSEAFAGAPSKPNSMSGEKLIEWQQKDIYKLNYRRCFGDSTFDVVVNFAEDVPEQAFTAYNAGQSKIMSAHDCAAWIAAFEAAQDEWEVEKL